MEKICPVNIDWGDAYMCVFPPHLSRGLIVWRWWCWQAERRNLLAALSLGWKCHRGAEEQRNQLGSVFYNQMLFFFLSTCVKGVTARLELGVMFSCSHVWIEAKLFFLSFIKKNKQIIDLIVFNVITANLMLSFNFSVTDYACYSLSNTSDTPLPLKTNYSVNG